MRTLTGPAVDEPRAVHPPLTRVNLLAHPRHRERAHGGLGEVEAARVAVAADVAGACDFLDYVEMPLGTSIGDHRHGWDEEEYYLVLSGAGTMRLDDEVFVVGEGDLVRNRPGGRHGLRNAGPGRLRLFVFQIRVGPR